MSGLFEPQRIRRYEPGGFLRCLVSMSTTSRLKTSTKLPGEALGRLAMVGLVAICTTSALSLLVRAQTQGAPATQAFEAASVKRAAPPNGSLQVRMGGGPGRIA